MRAGLSYTKMIGRLIEGTVTRIEHEARSERADLTLEIE